jgi:hypothetical protein
MEIQSRDRKALIGLGVALGLFVILQFDFILPAPGSGAPDAGTVEGVEQAFRLAHVKARRKPLVDAEAQATSNALAEIEKRLLASENAALAKAEMRQLVEDLLTAEGIAMRGSRFGTVALEGEDYAQVPLIVDFECQIEQFVNWMAAVANAAELLSTRRIQLNPGNRETKSVRAQVAVSGYLPVSRTPELVQTSASSGVTL